MTMTKLQFQPMMESRPIREIAYEVLKQAIISGEIPAGERIATRLAFPDLVEELRQLQLLLLTHLLQGALERGMYPLLLI